MTFRKTLAAAVTVFTLSSGIAHADPPADEARRLAQLQARRDQMQRLLDRLGDADGMSRQDARDLAAAYGEFHQEVRAGSFSFAEAGFGLGVGSAGSLLAGEGLGLAGGLWGLAITAYLSIIADGLYNAALIDMAIDNTALYGWLVDYLHYNRTGAIEDRILTWFDDHSDILHRVTGERPPRRHERSFLGLDFLARDQYDRTEVRDYLRRHSVRLLFFFGMLEETHGARAFPRYIFPNTDPILRRNRYREILRPRMQRELRTIIQEIDRVLNAARPRTTSAAPAPAATPADVAPVVALTGGGATPVTATVSGAGDGGSNVTLWSATSGGTGTPGAGGGLVVNGAAPAGLARD
jgi:hypothetical protein